MLGIGTFVAILAFIVCCNKKEIVSRMAERMCLVSYSRASGATEWNVASVCASPLLVHVVTPPSQEGSERITFISQ